ncbi:hypothetical protein BDF20DRAFT_837217 [Mycotypha africana]|uniref:uncharacterized protein n=1 Tax=Mycotypha africana TaxID=64632 RepID=UPI0023001BD3|nr:uncharacterized protein BDF20DRAFT_837217 [Mycotypha africana]KAI8973256.1 hypothetical protein BDF20DRAFT_837217 [Mycotypha africana]
MLTSQQKLSVSVSNEHCQHNNKLAVALQSMFSKIALFPCIPPFNYNSSLKDCNTVAIKTDTIGSISPSNANLATTEQDGRHSQTLWLFLIVAGVINAIFMLEKRSKDVHLAGYIPSYFQHPLSAATTMIEGTKKDLRRLKKQILIGNLKRLPDRKWVHKNLRRLKANRETVHR